MTIPDLVTLEQAKWQLRVDDTEHDGDIQMKIRQASHIVVDYLKYKEFPPPSWMVGSPPTMEVPALVEAGVLLQVSELYHNREASVVNLISPAVVALFDRFRDPALA